MSELIHRAYKCIYTNLVIKTYLSACQEIITIVIKIMSQLYWGRYINLFLDHGLISRANSLDRSTLVLSRSLLLHPYPSSVYHLAASEFA